MNTTQTLEEAIRYSGIGLPDQIIEDGQFHRYQGFHDGPGKENCWYVSHGTRGAFGSWKTGQKFKWRNGISSSKSMGRKEAQRHRMSQRIQKEARWERAASEACSEWERAISAQSIKENGYVQRKGIIPYAAKGDNTMLLVPMYFKHGIVNLQTILFNGKKYFRKGAQVQGACLTIGDRPSSFILCEGYATGCSLYEHTGETVVIAFNANNLRPVALRLRKAFPDADLLIAADNDRETKLRTGINPGIEKAAAAAAAAGCEYMYPDFSEKDFDGTDFNDYLVQGGKL